jgi:AraC-like DNA-binding protein
MIYQHNFQAEEIPAMTHISCRNYYTDYTQSFPLHCHAHYEISFMFYGKRHEYHNGKDFTIEDGSLFFLSPLAIHGTQNTAVVHDMILQFSSDFLHFISPSFEKNMNLYTTEDKPFLYVDQDSSLYKDLCEIRDISQELEHESNTKNAIHLELLQCSCLLKIIGFLIDDGFLSIQQGAASYSQLLLLDRVIEQILAHPDHVPDMKTAAHMTGFSYYNFSRIFQRVTGIHYSEYCTLLRVRFAEELLINSDDSLAEIAARIGIENPGYSKK